MSALSYKTLFRKGGTASAILAVALLVAILASINSMVNHINSQADVLGEGYLDASGTFLILSRNSNAISDSHVDAELASLVGGVAEVMYTLPQRVLTATLILDSGNHTFLMRGVGDVGNFLTLRGASVNGASAKGEAEANAGEILARLTGMNPGDRENLTVGNTALKLTVVGIVKTNTQNDAELIVPMEVIQNLTGNDSKVSVVEFKFKEDAKGGAVLNLTELLPKDVKVVKTQQLKEFMQDMSGQTLIFLNLWSITVYIVVAAASYVISMRLMAESSYELATIRTLGAKKRVLFTLILTYIVTITLLGSLLGLALGTAGTQTASTLLTWIRTGAEVNPFLEPGQALQTLLLALASSSLGCLYPAFRCARRSYMEQTL